jgi:hypothetical protein
MVVVVFGGLGTIVGGGGGDGELVVLGGEGELLIDGLGEGLA